MGVAIDIAKTQHVVLVEHPDGRRRRFPIANTLEDFTKFSVFLRVAAFIDRTSPFG